MKKYLIFVFVMCAWCQQAQTGHETRPYHNTLGLSYVWGHFGGSVCLDHELSRGAHTFFYGIKWFNSQPVTDNMGYAYRHRGYAASFPEALGLSIGYRYTFAERTNTSFYGFFLTQPASLRMRYSPDNFTETFTLVENTVGAGMLVRLAGKLHLHQSAGFGVATVFHPSHIISGPIGSSSEISGIIRTGLVFKL